VSNIFEEDGPEHESNSQTALDARSHEERARSDQS
jgi:hypothetical protein